MYGEFKKFLLQTNALALAIGVIIGGAVGKVVASLASDVLMPIISLAIPGGAWRTAAIVLNRKPDGTPASQITYGAFFGVLLDFIIIAAVVFLITKMLVKPPAPTAAPATKHCGECCEEVLAAAKRCKYCGSPC